MAIKAVNRATKRFADLGGITREYEDYEVHLRIRFQPATEYSGECYYAVDAPETLGELEICEECGESWLCMPGSVYDEERCVCCGGER